MVLVKLPHFSPPVWFAESAAMLQRIIPENRSKIKCQIAKLWDRQEKNGEGPPGQPNLSRPKKPQIRPLTKVLGKYTIIRVQSLHMVYGSMIEPNTLNHRNIERHKSKIPKTFLNAGFPHTSRKAITSNETLIDRKDTESKYI